MVEHLVFFRLQPDTTEEQKTALMETLRSFPPQIDVIRDLQTGVDFSGRGKGHEIGLRVRFDNKAGLEIYGPHPVHQKFIDEFKHLWIDVTAIDFETD